tara:strand:+ start:2185 stop:2352 length:168 start_codon:yes stop_codon:yes gene_type:complete
MLWNNTIFMLKKSIKICRVLDTVWYFLALVSRFIYDAVYLFSISSLHIIDKLMVI